MKSNQIVQKIKCYPKRKKIDRGFLGCFECSTGRTPESDVAAKCHIVDISWKEGWHMSHGNERMTQPNYLEWVPCVMTDECATCINWWLPRALALRALGVLDCEAWSSLRVVRAQSDMAVSRYFKTSDFKIFWMKSVWKYPEVVQARSDVATWRHFGISVVRRLGISGCKAWKYHEVMISWID
jgi:hypothetical protein